MAEKHDSTARLSSAAAPRPTITLPPRPSFDTVFGTAASPGPMTLVSSFFADNYPDVECRSFSQLLAGAMASPLARSPSPFVNSSVGKELGLRDGDEQSSGFRQSRPSSLVIPGSPLFTVPPGFSPSGLLNSPGFFSPQGPFGMSHQQALAHVTAQAAFVQSHVHFQADYSSALVIASSEQMSSHTSAVPSATTHQEMLPVTSDSKGSVVEQSEASHSDKKSQTATLALDKPSDDGYNWRKYGQKQVKGSEYPRSYYKCTHLNCPVKKKVERSHDGHITEIIYKGQHNHDVPQPSRRGKDNIHHNGSINTQPKPEFGLHSQNETLSGSVELTSSQSKPLREQECTQITPIQLGGSSDSEEVDDAETRVEVVDNDEPNPKRRNTEVGPSEVATSHRTVTEPRIILQTRSEVDLLDDGYRWRKYGQKVVKGNPHPRSYYKCTYNGCNVRKHVERAPTDPKAVITTYEGKHNHDVPAARGSIQRAPNNNASHKVVAEKHTLLKGIEFGNSNQRPVVLQLKEEQITV